MNDYNEKILCDVSLFEMLMRQANMIRPDNLVLYLSKKDTAFILKPTPGHQIEFTQFRQLRTDYYHTNIFSALSSALERVLTKFGNNHGYMTAVTDYMMADPSPISDDFITNVTSDFSRVSRSADKKFDFPYEMFRKDTDIKDELRTMIDVIVAKIKEESLLFAQELVLIDGQFLSNEIRKYMKLLNKYLGYHPSEIDLSRLLPFDEKNTREVFVLINFDNRNLPPIKDSDDVVNVEVEDVSRAFFEVILSFYGSQELALVRHIGFLPGNDSSQYQKFLIAPEYLKHSIPQGFENIDMYYIAYSDSPVDFVFPHFTLDLNMWRILGREEQDVARYFPDDWVKELD